MTKNQRTSLTEQTATDRLTLKKGLQILLDLMTVCL